MDHSAPMLANFEALPEILTAGELEKFLRIDVKTIYRYVQQGRIPYLRIESRCPLLETPHRIMLALPGFSLGER